MNSVLIDGKNYKVESLRSRVAKLPSSKTRNCFKS